MIDKKDAQWWILEAQRHPEAAVDLIRLLAERIAFLDRQNEELRGELIALQRKQRGSSASAETEALRQRVETLEGAARYATTERRLLIYGPGRIEVNQALSAVQQDGLGCEVSADVSMLLCNAGARLLAITADARVFSVPLAGLPIPTGNAIAFDAPRDVVVILDQVMFEQNRYLTLISQNGYAYSVLAGSLNRAAARQESLIRNLLPGDPIVMAVPSNNADLLAVSRKGRWTRFAEKAIAATGSQVMELPKGDTLAGMTWISSDSDLIFVTAGRTLFLRSSVELPSRKTPGRSAGLLIRDQALLGVTPIRGLCLLTRHGKLLTVLPGQLTSRAQSDSGMSVPGLAEDDSIVAFSAL